jgi:hypothetical protein
MSGAIIGTAVGGPLGTIVGGVIGAVAGGLVGKQTAENLDPTFDGAPSGLTTYSAARVVNPKAEDEYWRANYMSAPTYLSQYSYEDYGPAYQYGVASYAKYRVGTFEEVDTDLASNWESVRLNSRLSWTEARDATRAAWTRLGHA